MADYDNPRTQALARARANKWLAELFKPQNFSAIMKSVDPNPDKNAFTVACTNAGLRNPDEVEWLWAYLKNCKFALYHPIREAAQSGW